MTVFQTVQGNCPACQRSSLILGEGGYVTCSRLECPNPTAASERLEHPNGAARQRGRDIAFRAELVCCQIYNEVTAGRAGEELTTEFRRRQDDIRRHDLCYWGEAAAQIAEGHCPGYETVPNICQCPCPGCQSNCAAHNGGDQP